MKTKLLLYSALLLLTQCSKCKNDPTPEPPKDPLTLLPPETQTGAGTFGCLINGKAMNVRSSFLTLGDWTSPNSLRVLGSTSATGPEYSFQMVLRGRLSSGETFNLVSYRKPFAGIGNEFGANSSTQNYSCIYSGDYVKTGRIELVKFDGVQRIAAGRFAFILYEPGGCDTLRVTNGRFDVKF